MSDSPQDKTSWRALLEARLSRRDLLARALVAAGATALPFELFAARPEQMRGRGTYTRPPFTPIRRTTRDDLVLPRGYRYDVVRAYGDPISATERFGYNADFTAFFSIDALDGGRSSRDGLLWVNHEYVNPLFMYGYHGGEKTAQQIALEKQAVGGSVLRVTRDRTGRWRFVADARNRRVTGTTRCRLTGPAAGSAGVGGAWDVEGSVGNCSGGATPWHTVLSCEENYQDYELPVSASGYGWPDFPAAHHGWVVEVDPFDANSTPLKRTALGRFRHENVALRMHADGRVVAYMGDDKQDSCVYKFVSDRAYRPNDRAHNLRLLESGRLYAANFGAGTWLLLDYDQQQSLRQAKEADGSPFFRSQADVLLDARAAALALGATPVDRPEDIEIHPHTSAVFIALTNNALHGNYHGQIVRLIETGNDPAATSFEWDFFAVGGRQSGFSSPDNLIFDAHGNLWMATDITTTGQRKGIYEFQGNNALFFFATEGPDAGKAVQFASGPVDCELTGPWWTPDGSTLFLSVQHPGEESPGLDQLTSHWPANDGKSLPLPAVVAITGFPAWPASARYHAW